MSDTFLLIELAVVFIGLCLLRVPIAIAMAGSALLLMVQIGTAPEQVAAQIVSGVSLFVLLAIPFFLFAGELLTSARLTEDLVRTVQALVGRIRGGLGQVNIVVSMAFAGVSGSSNADVAATGSVLIPAMKDAGFKPRFAAAVTAASSTMGNIIPPSLYMIIYGSMAGVSIESLFIAGIVPGILIGLSQMGLVALQARKQQAVPPKGAENSALAGPLRLRTVSRTLAIGGIGVIVIGGLVFGFFTATEAAAIAAVYALLLFIVFRTTGSRRKLWGATRSTIQMSAAILFTIGAASAFGWVLAYLNGARLIADSILGVSENPYVILILISGVLLITGTFMSEIATIVIFTPIFIELQTLGGIDPLHMGVVVVMMLCLGLITPPYGICLLVSTKIAGCSFLDACIAIVPFVLVFLGIVALVIFIPQLAIFLPSVLT